MNDWRSLAQHGDQWLVAYACIPPLATSASLFSIGHAVELYLKASHASMHGDVGAAIKFGHRIKDLWDSCKSSDPHFMPSYKLHKDIFSTDFLDSGERSSLPKERQLHLLENQHLYLVFKHVQDLKYLGLPWKTRKPAPSQIAFIHPDPRWISFFRDLRSCINYPSDGYADHVEQTLELGVIPASSAIYLRGLYEQPSLRA